MRPEERVGRRVRQLREQRGWLQRDLANRLEEHGAQLSPEMLAKIESPGVERRVRLDEVYELALALDVPPHALLGTLPQDDPLEIGTTTVEADGAYRWEQGAGPLDDASRESYERAMRPWLDAAQLLDAIELQNARLILDRRRRGADVDDDAYRRALVTIADFLGPPPESSEHQEEAP